MLFVAGSGAQDAGVFFREQARQGFIPHATTGRMWLLRLGYYKLHAPLEQADDWI